MGAIDDAVKRVGDLFGGLITQTFNSTNAATFGSIILLIGALMIFKWVTNKGKKTVKKGLSSFSMR